MSDDADAVGPVRGAWPALLAAGIGLVLPLLGVLLSARPFQDRLDELIGDRLRAIGVLTGLAAAHLLPLWAAGRLRPARGPLAEALFALAAAELGGLLLFGLVILGAQQGLGLRVQGLGQLVSDHQPFGGGPALGLLALGLSCALAVFVPTLVYRLRRPVRGLGETELRVVALGAIVLALFVAGALRSAG